MTRAIATDLERRGYIVYVTVSSADEEQIVKSENRSDIKALWMDLTTVSDLSPAMESKLTCSIRLPLHPPISTPHCKKSDPSSPNHSHLFQEYPRTPAS